MSNIITRTKAICKNMNVDIEDVHRVLDIYDGSDLAGTAVVSNANGKDVYSIALINGWHKQYVSSGTKPDMVRIIRDLSKNSFKHTQIGMIIGLTANQVSVLYRAKNYGNHGEDDVNE